MPRLPLQLVAIAHLEDLLQVQFPEDVRRAYLRHDGCVNPGLNGLKLGKFFPFDCWWGSLDEVRQGHESRMSVLRDLARSPKSRELIYPEDESDWGDLEVRPVWFDQFWVPLGVSNTSTIVSCDLNPGPRGRRGQLIADFGSGEATVMAESFDAFLELLIVGVESGKLAMREGGWTRLDTGARVSDWAEMRRTFGL